MSRWMGIVIAVMLSIPTDSDAELDKLKMLLLIQSVMNVSKQHHQLYCTQVNRNLKVDYLFYVRIFMSLCKY